MLFSNSKNDKNIRLTEERWEHIVRRHPEMNEFQDKVLETIHDPDLGK